MTNEVLAVKEVGPLGLEVIGAETLCIKSDGDANLTPLTATVRIKNMSLDPVIVGHSFEPRRSFKSNTISSSEGSRDVITFHTPPAELGDPGPMDKILQPNETLLISSWTRHHNYIWSKEVPRTTGLTSIAPREYNVGFDLSLTYDSGSGPVPIDETFDITFIAVPVVRDDI